MRDAGPSRSIEEEGRAIVECLGGRWTPRGGMCRCPAHDDRRPSLSVRPGRSRLLLHCFAGCPAMDILRELERIGAIAPSAADTRDLPASRGTDGSRSAALRLWSEARSIVGSPAERYLVARGLCSHSPELRFHPRTPDGPSPLTQFRPAMIAAVRDDTGVVAIHRSFIDPQGSRLADFSEPRRGLGRFGRGAVRLGGTAPRLGLAEGIETALSASALFGIACWATLGTERFRLVALPPEVCELMLFLDHDPGGRRAEALAREAYARLPRIEAHYPPQPGEDWNDVLRACSSRGRRERGEEAARG